MRKVLIAAIVAGLALVASPSPAAAEHNGPYCQAENRSGMQIFAGHHDYCTSN